MPTVTTIASALADVPEGTITLGTGTDAHGLANIWLIFPDVASREAYRRKYIRTWIETATMASFTDYCMDWNDVNGYGLQLSTYMPDRIGLPRA
jgi:hypothetical protein